MTHPTLLVSGLSRGPETGFEGDYSTLVAQRLPIHEIGQHYAVTEDLSASSNDFLEADFGLLRADLSVRGRYPDPTTSALIIRRKPQNLVAVKLGSGTAWETKRV